MTSNYQICTKCIMNKTDPNISFDKQGICNHCKKYQKIYAKEQKADVKKINQLVKRVKKERRGKKYDCIIGLSGGVDSTYVAFIVKKMGLRPLAVHLDNRWNTKISQKNIENTVSKLNIDLYTHKVNWDKFKDLQLAFLRASTPDAENPTDHSIEALLYHVAAQKNIPYIIKGNNSATEAILPKAWSYCNRDWKYIKSIHKKFGKTKLKNYPHLSLAKRIYYTVIKKIRKIYILNYITYDKNKAMKKIEEKLDWNYYGGKHYESIYTRFFQGYILPRKFNIDKRRAHYSTLICSGQMTRKEALKKIKNNPYPSEKMKQEDKEHILKKLELSNKEFEKIMSLPIKTFRDYPNNHYFFKMFLTLRTLLKKFKFGTKKQS